MSLRGSQVGDPNAVVSVPYLLAGGFEGRTSESGAVDIASIPESPSVRHYGSMTQSHRRQDVILDIADRGVPIAPLLVRISVDVLTC